MRRFSLLFLLTISVLSLQAQNLSLRWELLSNFYQGRRQAHCVLVLTNTGREALPPSGWALYFNGSSTPQAGPTPAGLQIDNLSGCLFRLRPTLGFLGIGAGDSVRMEYIASDYAANTSDAPEGWYLVFDNAPSKGYPVAHYTKTPITRPELFDRYPGDHIPEATPSNVYTWNQQADPGEAPDLLPLFPTPQSVRALGDSGAFYKGGAIFLGDDAFAGEAAYLKEQVRAQTGLAAAVRAATGAAVAPGAATGASSGADGIYLVKAVDTLPDEGYRLHLLGGVIRIEASTPAGMFYGIQTLLRLFPAGPHRSSYLLPALAITDQPRFSYRSLMLDVGRNFQTYDEILRVLDLMAFCKLNVFHFHLTDDEGWRLQIPTLPELTSVGAKRGHTLDDKDWLRPCYGSGPDTSSPTGSGYYTRAQFIHILTYAQRLHIRVIPEIESPGHARAAIKSMDNRYRRLMAEGRPTEALEFLLRDTTDQSVYSTPQAYHDDVMNVALPSVYRFIGRVTSELVSMYHDAGVPLETIHLGGDEVPAGVWERSPACLALVRAGVAASGVATAASATAGAMPQTVGDLWYYYFGKVDSILRGEGLYTSAWEEAGMRKTLQDGHPAILPNPDFAGGRMQVHIWNNGGGAEDLAYRMANGGYKVVLSVASHLYFDMSYNKSFDEFGYYWATFQDADKPFTYIPFDYLRLLQEDEQGNPLPPGLKASKERLTDYGKSNIVGLEGCLWGETLRGAGGLEYKLLPKLLGMAERAWAPDPVWATQHDTLAAKQASLEAWYAFASLLGRHILPQLDTYNGGYAYRIPPPGVMVRDGQVWANVQLPGLVIRYTVNGQEPGPNSALYRQPLRVHGKVRLRVFNTVGRGSRVVEVMNE
ncbi:family 20 glycosylhydrolase [Dinghuibacter silviterrae]|uniref:beta-N-acetylhexosaminidase n=1 Tax=Dinghuibacter silviterrae TaxID=1539049 RepID=A0A4V3GKX9_9BACT|nr:family 20 glycosylhydrolase [Dinghuibacter silviterrae]TDW97382.1 hexosaminidase [Dinghuibacter silviterrae]